MSWTSDLKILGFIPLERSAGDAANVSPRLMSSNTDPLLSDSFKCRKSETVHAAPLSAPATSEKSDFYYGKETDKCLKNSSTHVAQVSGFLTFFVHPFFLLTRWF